ncbi:MAG: hypothetical protein KDB80_04745 [Planctomycetes bacterium]|nr:hypothetical protein [Planctomycetota bacterium]
MNAISARSSLATLAALIAGTVTAQTYTSNPGVPIDDHTVFDEIVVASGTTIVDVAVEPKINHTYVGDPDVRA